MTPCVSPEDLVRLTLSQRAGRRPFAPSAHPNPFATRIVRRTMRRAVAHALISCLKGEYRVTVEQA